MNPRARRLISWTFILAFFVIAPVLILSTAGYRYNFERGRLERTGVVIVESRPTGARISLNNQPQKRETPARLGRVTPGSYAVLVEKAGFHSWTKNVSVGSRETVFLNRISLFRTGAPVPLETLGVPEAAAFSSDARYGAAVASASSGSELIVVDMKSGTARLPYRSSEAASAFRLDWSPKGQFLLVRREGKKPSFLVWNAADPERLRDLSPASSDALSEAFWAQDADRLYGVAGDALYEIDPVLLARAPKGSSIGTPSVAHGALYGVVADGNPSFVRRELGQETFETIAHLPSAAFAPVAYGEGRLTYASRSGDRLFTIDLSGNRPTAFEGRGRDGAWSADGSQFLYWNDLELRIHDTRTSLDTLVNRVSTPITQAAWQRPEWNVLYASGNALYGIETEDRFGRILVPLAEFEALKAFVVSPNGDTAFIFGTKNGTSGLWKLPLR